MHINKTLGLYKSEKIRDGISMVDNDTWIKNIDMDFQPYSTDLLLRVYGYNIQVTNRLFIDYQDVNIVIGMKFKDLDFEGNVKHIYQVQKIIDWDNYSEVFVLEVAK